MLRPGRSDGHPLAFTADFSMLSSQIHFHWLFPSSFKLISFFFKTSSILFCSYAVAKSSFKLTIVVDGVAEERCTDLVAFDTDLYFTYSSANFTIIFLGCSSTVSLLLDSNHISLPTPLSQQQQQQQQQQQKWSEISQHRPGGWLSCRQQVHMPRKNQIDLRGAAVRRPTRLPRSRRRGELSAHCGP